MVFEKNGKCVIFSAPSGAGKTTIVRRLLKTDLNLEFSISACSRGPRENEIDGHDYYFLGLEGFNSKIKEDAFVEWEEVYKDHFYGTLNSEMTRIWDNNNAVVFDVDVIGGLNIKKKFGENALSVFVQPPSYEELERRLKSRSTETQDKIKQRLDKAHEELEFAKDFDVIIVNDNLDEAVQKAENIIREFLK